MLVMIMYFVVFLFTYTAVLNKGFPIPKIKDLDFVSPQVSFVKVSGAGQASIAPFIHK